MKLGGPLAEVTHLFHAGCFGKVKIAKVKPTEKKSNT